ncbi:hypothetical protein ZIOFF_004412 [Zingiber officinale]|uniref:DUF7806 domain-containing protein n=1 Tax=Zingiber officinale TaxID=94328 RepID=A0A8J5MB83_ZINOF|nr:hypothetical protein ZIOFF_004412 [Zingiber officinale]
MEMSKKQREKRERRQQDPALRREGAGGAAGFDVAERRRKGAGEMGKRLELAYGFTEEEKGSSPPLPCSVVLPSFNRSSYRTLLGKGRKILFLLVSMEPLDVKLYEKYKNLKKRKFTEEEEWNHTRDAESRSFQSAVEDLIEELNKENKGLHQQLDSFQEKYDECRMLLLEEGKKSKELSDEVEKLQNLLLKKKEMNNALLFSSPCTSSKVRSEEISKSPPGQRITESCGENGTQHKVLTVVTYNNKKTGTSMKEYYKRNFSSPGRARYDLEAIQKSLSYLLWAAYEQQPSGRVSNLKQTSSVEDYERQFQSQLATFDHNNSLLYILIEDKGKQSDDRSNFIFQTLMRFLVGMDLYVDNQTESPSILVVHKTSGYSFSLTWI